MRQFKVEQKVEVIDRRDPLFGKIGKIVDIDQTDTSLPYRVKFCNDWSWEGEKDLKLVKEKETMKTKKGKKAKYQIGQIVYNEYCSQKSEVLAVFKDKEDERIKYVLKCLDDNGSIHLIYEESIRGIETIEVSLEELIRSYKENELQDSQEVKVIK